MSDESWKVPKAKAPKYTKEQRRAIERYERDLARQLAKKQPRLAHSLSVAKTAEAMACIYGEDPYKARVAGILHDWAKAYPDEVQRKKAARYKVDLGVDPKLVTGLFHGKVAARELPERYPELPKGVLRAIDRHTTGAKDMSRLDMVVFVADGIEPRRRNVPAIAEVRRMVDDRAPLADVFWKSFSNGVAYVIETGRYLWPGTLDVYNAYALKRR